MKSKFLIVFNLLNTMLFISFQQGCAGLQIHTQEERLLTYGDLKPRARETVVASTVEQKSLDFQIALPENPGDIEYRRHQKSFEALLDAPETVMLVAVSRKNGKDLAVDIFQPGDRTEDPLTICLDCKQTR